MLFADRLEVPYEVHLFKSSFPNNLIVRSVHVFALFCRVIVDASSNTFYKFVIRRPSWRQACWIVVVLLCLMHVRQYTHMHTHSALRAGHSTRRVCKTRVFTGKSTHAVQHAMHAQKKRKLGNSRARQCTMHARGWVTPVSVAAVW